MPLPQAKIVPSDRLYVDSSPVGEDLAKIVIIRDKTVAGFGAIGYHQVFLDGRRVASLAANEKLEMLVPSGEHVFGVLPTLSASTSEQFAGGWATYNLDQVLLPGRTYFYRILIDANASSRIQRYLPE